MANIVLVTKGTQGDVLPFLGIGKALHIHGHNVTMLTNCYYADVVKQANLDFIALDTVDEFEDFVRDGPLLNNLQGLPLFFRKHLLPKALSEYKMIHEVCQSRETILVIRHMSSVAAYLIAEKFNLPFIRVFMAPSEITTISLIARLCESTLADDINLIRSKADLPPVYDWHTWLNYPQRNIASWPEWFAASSNWLSKTVCVGFIRYNNAEMGVVPEEIRQLFDSGDSAILITGGTGMYMGASFYAVSAEACESLGRRSILVTRHEELVPRPLPDKIKWFKYLPLVNIMPHVAAIVHHGGMGTLALAMNAGVPQLVLASGADRLDNASRLKILGIAEHLPFSQWQPDLVAEALNRLVSSSIVCTRCKDIAQLLPVADPATVACNVIQEFIPSSPSPKNPVLETRVSNSEYTANLQISDSITKKLQQRLNNLSPERHALLALYMREKRKEFYQKPQDDKEEVAGNEF